VNKYEEAVHYAARALAGVVEMEQVFRDVDRLIGRVDSVGYRFISCYPCTLEDAERLASYYKLATRSFFNEWSGSCGWSVWLSDGKTIHLLAARNSFETKMEDGKYVLIKPPEGWEKPKEEQR